MVYNRLDMPPARRRAFSRPQNLRSAQLLCDATEMSRLAAGALIDAKTHQHHTERT